MAPLDILQQSWQYEGSFELGSLTCARSRCADNATAIHKLRDIIHEAHAKLQVGTKHLTTQRSSPNARQTQLSEQKSLKGHNCAQLND